MSIYEKAFEILRQRRKKALQDAENRYEAMCRSIEFETNEIAIRRLIPSIGFARAYNNIVEAQKLELEMSKLLTRKSEILQNHGLTISEFESKFYCKSCEDTGYLQGGLSCKCLQKLIIAELAKECGVAERELNSFADCNDDRFGDERSKEIINLYREKFEKYADVFPNAKKKNLCLIGPPGTGKTFLQNAIAHKVIERGFVVLYATAYALNEMFMKTHCALENEQKSIYMNNLINCDLLVIDDLGTESVYRNVTREYLFNLISERALKKKSIIVSTNCTIGQLVERYGERTISRLVDKEQTIVVPFNEVKNVRYQKVVV